MERDPSSPKPEKKSRAERLQNEIERKGYVLKNAENSRDKDQKSLELATEGEGSVYGIIKPHTDEVERMKKFETALAGLNELCTSIENADDPKEEIRNLLEILIQRDDEWAETEGGDDLRMVFFLMILQKGASLFISNTEALNQLRAHRSDDAFLSEAAAQIPSMRVKFADFDASNKRMIRYYERSNKRASKIIDQVRQDTPARIEKASRGIERAERHIARLSSILEDELKKSEEPIPEDS